MIRKTLVVQRHFPVLGCVLIRLFVCLLSSSPPPSSSLSLGLHDITPHYIVLNPSFYQVQTAASLALENESNGRLISGNLYAEFMFCMTPSGNVAKAIDTIQVWIRSSSSSSAVLCQNIHSTCLSPPPPQPRHVLFGFVFYFAPSSSLLQASPVRSGQPDPEDPGNVVVVKFDPKPEQIATIAKTMGGPSSSLETLQKYCDKDRLTKLYSIKNEVEKAHSSLLQSVILRIGTKFVR